MKTLPWYVRLYIGALALAAGWILATTPGHIPLISTAVFALAYAIMEAFPVMRKERELFTLAGTIACLATAALGAKAGMIVVLSGLGIAAIRLRLDWIKILFNGSQLVIMVWAAGSVFSLLGGSSGGEPFQVIFPFLAMYFTYWLANTIFISALFLLLDRTSIPAFLGQGSDLYIQQALVAVINCTVLASYWAFGEWALAVLVVVLLLVRYAMAAYDHARSFYIQLIQLLTGVMEAQDQFTHGHSERVAHYASEVGRKLGLADTKLDVLKTAALLHDVGKMKIPREILHKATPLTEAEFDLIKQHPVTGAEWVARLDSKGTLAKIIRHHHERWDGTGYPDGIAGTEIPELARIITVVDAFDAMTSDRPYRPGFAPEKALDILRNDAGRHFDPRVVRAFLACSDSAISGVPPPSLAMAHAAAAKQDDAPAITPNTIADATEEAAGRV